MSVFSMVWYENQKQVYCQVGFQLQGIRQDNLVHNCHNKHSKRKAKAAIVYETITANDNSLTSTPESNGICVVMVVNLGLIS